jgi:hypothetical protein
LSKRGYYNNDNGFSYTNCEEIVNDILVKPLSNEKFHYLMKRWLFGLLETNKYGGLQFDHLEKLND